MARIARRGLRIRSLPLFTFGEPCPWQSVAEADGSLALRLYEPRYLELARRVLPPAGDGKFGYAEDFPPRPGGAGILAVTQQFRWSSGTEGAGPVAVKAQGARRFRILAVKKEPIVVDKAPLLLAHVQLLENRDTVRGSGMEGWRYWMHKSADDASGDGKPRSASVAAGTSLKAKQGAPVFETMESWKATHSVPEGVLVVAAGPPRVVEGYLMVPILPSGAVELTLFREVAAGDEKELPTEHDLQAALEKFDTNMSQDSENNVSAGSSRRRVRASKGRGRSL